MMHMVLPYHSGVAEIPGAQAQVRGGGRPGGVLHSLRVVPRAALVQPLLQRQPHSALLTHSLTRLVAGA